MKILRDKEEEVSHESYSVTNLKLKVPNNKTDFYFYFMHHIIRTRIAI